MTLEDEAMMAPLDPEETRSGTEPEDEVERGEAQNAILAYLSRVGKDPLLTRAEERDLDMAMEEGTRRTFECLVRIPFCRELLLTFPERLTSGEVAL